jgi:hypothetical protein
VLTDWSSVLLSSNVDAALDQFLLIFKGILNEIAPFRDIRVKQRTEPWVNTDILAGIRKRDDLFRRFRNDRSRTDLYQDYCKTRNKVQRDVELVKQYYFRDKIDQNRNNSKKLVPA